MLKKQSRSVPKLYPFVFSWPKKCEVKHSGTRKKPASLSEWAGWNLVFDSVRLCDRVFLKTSPDGHGS
jgi:hypothetical protein